MPDANYAPGQQFAVQFVWKLPNQDFLRAVFEAEVLAQFDAASRYLVRLRRLIAGRQETAAGDLRPPEERSPEYWQLVVQIEGRRISLAYEADDGRPLHMRLTTLTGEHDFFSRFAD